MLMYILLNIFFYVYTISIKCSGLENLRGLKVVEFRQKSLNSSHFLNSNELERLLCTPCNGYYVHELKWTNCTNIFSIKYTLVTAASYKGKIMFSSRKNIFS